MTTWLLPENRAALESVWPKSQFSGFIDVADLIGGTFVAEDFEADFNMAALAWLEEESPVESITLRFGAGRTVTEQIIEAVRVWADGGDTVDRVDGEEGKA